jgi:glyoxylase-like metal-dependent hydrolase (beta-lactamase superfamily II)
MDIGSYTISTFETGDFALDGGAMFGVVPKTLWMKAYHTGDDHNRIDMTARSLLIRGNGRIILIDTGCGHKMAEKLANIYRLDYSRASIEQSLQSHGITPEEITDVVLTHLHFDHVGGATKKLSNGDIIPTFPNAMYHVQKEQLQWAQSPTDKDRASFMPENWDPLIANGMLNVLEGDGEVFQGINVQRVYGHTCGLQVIHVQDDRHHIVFPADLIPTAAHIPVPYVMGYDNFPLTSMEEKHELLTQASEQGWIICFEHDAFTKAGTIKRTEKGFSLDQIVSI